jgi:hypothetical protein
VVFFSALSPPPHPLERIECGVAWVLHRSSALVRQ